ncbi:MAG TPA: galactokinase [Terriglobales bacterium]|nr:galactokinase [Terriglobales bacterium]
MMTAGLARQFEGLFGTAPKIFSAPGRVNLIGEHTDYNDGFVMPCAIGLSTRVAISPREDRALVLGSDEFPDQFEVDLSHLPSRGTGVWSDYVVGVAAMLQRSGHSLPGANLLVRGGVPMGAGLSSSAALEVASALALISLQGTVLPLPEIAKLCQRAENVFIGARVGIMDQFVSCLGKAAHALMLDCRSLDFQLIPIPENVRLVICNTMVKHEHAGGEYNRRREECERGVKLLTKWYPDTRALRDISVPQLEEHSRDLPDPIYRRCLHVVEENQRVRDAAQLLIAGALSGVGDLMRASHRSLRDLYEVSCRELNVMVEVAEGLPGYYGGRMTGGGFGGSTVNLVNALDAEAFAGQVAERYQRETGKKPLVYICSAADGAHAE